MRFPRKMPEKRSILFSLKPFLFGDNLTIIEAKKMYSLSVEC